VAIEQVVEDLFERPVARADRAGNPMGVPGETEAGTLRAGESFSPARTSGNANGIFTFRYKSSALACG